MARYHVATTGSNNDDGLTPATAFATLDRALAAASGGDEIVIAPGTYLAGVEGSTPLQAYTKLLAGLLTIRGDVDGSVCGTSGEVLLTDLRADGLALPVESTFEIIGGDWVIQDLTIERLRADRRTIGMRYDGVQDTVASKPVILTRGGDVTLRRVTIRGGSSAVYQMGGSLTLDDCTIDQVSLGLVRRTSGSARLTGSTIRARDWGVLANDASRTYIYGSRIEADYPIMYQHGSDLEVAGSELLGGELGLSLAYTDRATVYGSRITGEGSAISSWTSSRVVVRGSDISGWFLGVSADDQVETPVEIRGCHLHDVPTVALLRNGGRMLIADSVLWRYAQLADGTGFTGSNNTPGPADPIVGMTTSTDQPLSGNVSAKLMVGRVAIPQDFQVPADGGSPVTVTGLLHKSYTGGLVRLTLGDQAWEAADTQEVQSISLTYTPPATGVYRLRIWAETTSYIPGAYVQLDDLEVQ